MPIIDLHFLFKQNEAQWKTSCGNETGVSKAQLSYWVFCQKGVKTCCASGGEMEKSKWLRGQVFVLEMECVWREE